jgi:hypothetical protein
MGFAQSCAVCVGHISLHNQLCAQIRARSWWATQQGTYCAIYVGQLDGSHGATITVE